ncbi:MAG TPA: DUF5107 domain-containing protein, partial [Solirubrobacteraceae bacterium]|nr:DUF5107 domain-containing protein [Solirubrobacteraceae bacterium]
WCSDHDPFTRMKGMHGVRLHPDRATVELVVRLHNRTSEVQTFLWWANVAAAVHDEYQSFFPTDVHYVADHARRAITAFPAADRRYYGVDYAARAADGRNRLDFYRNIPVPTSYMVTDTRDDFFGGYDHRAGAGFVHVADRHIAPGKKQWTWGNAPFGHAWDRLLTDHDGPYVELMAGVYTDNQPDFSWLEPGETKTFTQVWFPIQQIGPAHQANVDAAVRLDVSDAEVALGLCVTAARPGTRVVVTGRDRILFDQTVDLAPGEPFTARVPARGYAAPDVEVAAVQDGTDIIRWRPRPVSRGTEPQPATEPPPPDRIASVDELYLTGVHLAQYRHPTRSPLPYWEEALRRDPEDARCNLALADDAYRRADYAAAETFARRALARLTLRNANPRDGEASYLLGLILARTGREEDAVDAFSKAAWDSRRLAPASVELSRLHARAGDDARSLDRARTALSVQPDDSRARTLEVVVLRRLGRDAEAAARLESWLAVDPLDQLARALAGAEAGRDARTAIDVALELAAAGAIDDALRMLDAAIEIIPTAAGRVRPIAHYHRAELLDRAGRTAEAAGARRSAAGADPERCFPAGLDDHDALRAALAADPSDGRAAALLAMLLLDRGRAAEALELWQSAIEGGLQDAVAYRNAAITVYNVNGDATRALDWYVRALERDPVARLLYERDQLLKRTGAAAHERLALLDQERPEVLRRDDLTVEYCRLLVRVGRAVEAFALMESRRFAPWEGGEGLTIAAWEDATLALSDAARARGDLVAAAAFARRAIDLPETLGEARHALTDTQELHERLAAIWDAAGRPEDAATTRASAVVSSVAPVAASPTDSRVDYFATSLPDLLLFARHEPHGTRTG